MSDEPDPPLDEDELALWREMTRDVAPLAGQKRANLEKIAKKTEKSSKKQDIQPENLKINPKSSELDRKTEEKLRKGQINIDFKLDLHGFSQEKAQNKLFKVINTAIKAKKRCILVITGKGKAGSAAPDWSLNHEKGVLREKLPLWLHHPDIAPHILKLVPAAPKDGGAGAFYIYLRRQRQA